jgi:hypothetical protein
MTLHGTLKQERISWRSVGAMSAVLVTFAVMAAVLWPQPEPLLMPPRVAETPEPFVPSPAFEAANDLAVLQAVLEKPCKADTTQVLSSKPDGYTGNRSSHRPGTFPDGLGCPGIRIIDSGELDILFSKPYRGKRDFKHQGGWGNFYDAYPEAFGVLTLSLPSYPTATSAVVQLGATCGRLCGSGWEVTLAKVGGKWVVRERRPSWIA